MNISSEEKKLYFIHNGVTGLEYGTLKIIRNLQAPFLDYNESDNLGPEIFTEKTQLGVIHLLCNYLDFISNAKLSPLKKLKVLTLRNNNLNGLNSCQTAQSMERLKKKLQMTCSPYKCQYMTEEYYRGQDTSPSASFIFLKHNCTQK